MSDELPIQGIISTYSDKLADKCGELGAIVTKVYDYDGINLWKCVFSDRELIKNPAIIQLYMDAVMQTQRILFARITPEIYVASVDGTIAYTTDEQQESEITSVIFSRDKSLLMESVSEGEPIIVSDWTTIEQIVKDALDDNITHITFLLGGDCNNQLCKEVYSLGAVKLVLEALSAIN